MHNHSGTSIVDAAQIILAVPFIFAAALYVAALVYSRRKGRKWPVYRTVLWMAGVLSGLAAVSGPIAVQAHSNFTVHMLGHLLLGMLAPLLMALAAPMTLFLRASSVNPAKKVTSILRTSFVRFLSDPITASILNVGGLWVLYTTSLFEAMHESLLLHLFIHIHVFLAGYLFTISLIYIDPAPHRRSFVYRSAVMVAALAGHGILSKYIYGNPPSGVPRHEAESGGMLMYYGGDLIDVIIIFFICLQWYRASRPYPAGGFQSA
ncbi:cytochrome c oxidase assembly protein [Halobacillus sp. Marseille-Q1614]|uniref:cytochrome c oxidase assembly protein n=1 Tax=Halobacillus sp. Marseille-Q1614 TaxID=2709134 RepID=UPI001570D16A|nr:cytochrome c oxidase assembly protein [Halobacillus sp. Marseille-Q1614]